MYRISVTSLEAFRRFRDKHSVWDTEERLLNVLSGKKEPNSYATIGSCFHKIVETGKATYIGNGIFEQEEDGVIVRLNSKAVENAIYYRNKYPGEHEVHGGKDFYSSLFDIHVHGYADLKYDKVIRDTRPNIPLRTQMIIQDRANGLFILISLIALHFILIYFSSGDIGKICLLTLYILNLFLMNP